VQSQLVVAYAKRGFPGAGVVEVKQNANGFSVVTLGPQCSVLCMATEVVSKGPVLWAVVAVSSTRSSAPVENFIASFQPFG
jgi:hypothetical protein